MPKAQVLVTVTAEEFVDVPDGVEDVDGYVRQRVSLVWGDADATDLQAPAISVEYFLVPEPEPEVESVPEPVADAMALTGASEPADALSDTLPLPVATSPAPISESPRSEAEVANAFAAWLDDPASRSVLKSAVRDRAAVLIESVVDQVIAELEPLLRRHRDKNAAGAQ